MKKIMEDLGVSFLYVLMYGGILSVLCWGIQQICV